MPPRGKSRRRVATLTLATGLDGRNATGIALPTLSRTWNRPMTVSLPYPLGSRNAAANLGHIWLDDRVFGSYLAHCLTRRND